MFQCWLHQINHSLTPHIPHRSIYHHLHFHPIQNCAQITRYVPYHKCPAKFLFVCNSALCEHFLPSLTWMTSKRSEPHTLTPKPWATHPTHNHRKNQYPTQSHCNKHHHYNQWTHPPQKPIAFPLEKHQTFAKPTNLNTFAALRERERERGTKKNIWGQKSLLLVVRSL